MFERVTQKGDTLCYVWMSDNVGKHGLIFSMTGISKPLVVPLM